METVDAQFLCVKEHRVRGKYQPAKLCAEHFILSAERVLWWILIGAVCNACCAQLCVCVCVAVRVVLQESVWYFGERIYQQRSNHGEDDEFVVV